MPRTNESYLICVIGNADGFPGYATFWRTATLVGIDRADCLVVDVSDAPHAIEETIRDSGATTAICLGAAAFAALTGIRRSIDKTRGYLFQPTDSQAQPISVREQIGLYRTTKKGKYQKGDPKYGMVVRLREPVHPSGLRWIIPTLDPRTIQKARFKTLPALKADLTRAARSLDSRFTFLRFDYDIRPFLSLGSDGIVAFDIETDGIGGAINRIGVTTGAGTWTAPWNSISKSCFQAMLDGGPTLLVGHNLAFDIPRLEHAGIVFPDTQLFDTMLAAHLIAPDLYKGLEKVASLYLDLRPWKHLSGSDPATYNAVDVGVTFLLAERMSHILSETGQYELFCSTMMPALRTLMNMTRRGLRVDRIRLGEWQTELTTAIETHMVAWEKLHPTVEPSSPVQLRRLFYDDLKLPEQFQQTKEGLRITTDEAALRELRSHAPESVDTLLALRKAQKLRSVYASLELGRHDRVHPNYLPANKDTDAGAAASGRLASSDPNIQNQPDEARRLFIPSQDDWWFVEFDYSQIELRIAAARARDEVLLDALGGDVHARTMELVGCDRTRAKNLMYGSLYGAGPRKLAATLRAHGQPISETEARDLQHRMAAAYPRLWAWRDRVVREGTTLGYLTNAFGRRRYFYNRYRDPDTGEMKSGDVPEMLAYLPSSDAADILWSRLSPLESFAEEFDGHLVTTVHDSFLLEFPPESVGKDLFRSLRSLLEIEFPMIAPGFRVPGNIKMGRTWGEMTTSIA